VVTVDGSHSLPSDGEGESSQDDEVRRSSTTTRGGDSQGRHSEDNSHQEQEVAVLPDNDEGGGGNDDDGDDLACDPHPSRAARPSKFAVRKNPNAALTVDGRRSYSSVQEMQQGGGQPLLGLRGDMSPPTTHLEQEQEVALFRDNDHDGDEDEGRVGNSSSSAYPCPEIAPTNETDVTVNCSMSSLSQTHLLLRMLSDDESTSSSGSSSLASCNRDYPSNSRCGGKLRTMFNNRNKKNSNASGGGGYWKKLTNADDDDDASHHRRQHLQEVQLYSSSGSSQKGFPTSCRVDSTSRKSFFLLNCCRNHDTNSVLDENGNPDHHHLQRGMAPLEHIQSRELHQILESTEQHSGELRQTSELPGHNSGEVHQTSESLLPRDHELHLIETEARGASLYASANSSNDIMDRSTPEEEIVFFDSDESTSDGEMYTTKNNNDNGDDAEEVDHSQSSRRIEVVLGIDGKEQVILPVSRFHRHALHSLIPIDEENDSEDGHTPNRQDRHVSGSEENLTSPDVIDILCQLENTERFNLSCQSEASMLSEGEQLFDDDSTSSSSSSSTSYDCNYRGDQSSSKLPMILTQKKKTNSRSGGHWKKLANASYGVDDEHYDDLHRRRQILQVKRLHSSSIRKADFLATPRIRLMLRNFRKGQDREHFHHEAGNRNQHEGGTTPTDQISSQEHRTLESALPPVPSSCKTEPHGFSFFVPASSSYDILDLTPPEEEIVFLDIDDESSSDGGEYTTNHDFGDDTEELPVFLSPRHVEFPLEIDGKEEVMLPVSSLKDDTSHAPSPPASHLVPMDDDDPEDDYSLGRQDHEAFRPNPDALDILCQLQYTRSRSLISNLSSHSELSRLSAAQQPLERMHSSTAAYSASKLEFSALGYNGAQSGAVAEYRNSQPGGSSNQPTTKEISTCQHQQPRPPQSDGMWMEFQLNKLHQTTAEESLEMITLCQGMLNQMVPSIGQVGKVRRKHLAKRRGKAEVSALFTQLRNTYNQGPLVAPSKCLVLLMHPEQRIFEVIPVFFDIDRSTIGDLLAQIPQQATDYRLKHQVYTGLAHNGRYIITPMIPLKEILKENPDGRPLFAVPANYSAEQIELFGTTLLKNLNVIRMIQDHQALLGMSSPATTIHAKSNGGNIVATTTEQNASKNAHRGTSTGSVPTSIATTANSVSSMSSSEFGSPTSPSKYGTRKHGDQSTSRDRRTQIGSSSLCNKSPLLQRLVTLTTIPPSPLSSSTSSPTFEQQTTLIQPSLQGGESANALVSRRTSNPKGGKELYSNPILDF
jgi:hypothetical protein